MGPRSEHEICFIYTLYRYSLKVISCIFSLHLCFDCSLSLELRCGILHLRGHVSAILVGGIRAFKFGAVNLTVVLNRGGWLGKWGCTLLCLPSLFLQKQSYCEV